MHLDEDSKYLTFCTPFGYLSGTSCPWGQGSLICHPSCTQAHGTRRQGYQQSKKDIFLKVE